jgi:hypothetical protein
MPDTDILYFLGKERTILGKKYRVAWNCETNVAEVLRDEEPIANFPFELEAHKYIRDLRSLDQTGDPEAWRKITEEQDEARTTG